MICLSGTRERELENCCRHLCIEIGEPPRWLRGRMLKMAEKVETSRGQDKLLSEVTPTKLVKRLDAIARAAKVLAREINDPVVVAWLGDQGSSREALFSSGALPTIASLSAAAITRVRIKQGTRAAPPYPDYTMTGRQLCAWSIREALRQLGTISPGSSHDGAIQAVRCLWIASGGRDNLSDNTWIAEFEVVRRLEQSTSPIAEGLRADSLWFQAVRPEDFDQIVEVAITTPLR